MLNLDSLNPQILLDIAYQAGQAILEIYNSDDFGIVTKSDDSPLTKADQAANAVIVAGLEKHFPNTPIISEETKLVDYATRKNWETCWLVDPLDGTKEFIKRNGEFTVNIALIHKNESVAGFIYIPVQDRHFYAIKGQGSFLIAADGTKKRLEKATIDPAKPVHIVASRSHLNEDTKAFLEMQKAKYSNVDTVAAGSSLKFCLIAEGIAHFYPRFAPTMEWDTGAGQIIAEEAGATVTVQPDGTPLHYNRENLLNPYFLVSV